jgi:hypothetical protein
MKEMFVKFKTLWSQQYTNSSWAFLFLTCSETSKHCASSLLKALNIEHDSDNLTNNIPFTGSLVDIPNLKERLIKTG